MEPLLANPELVVNHSSQWCIPPSKSFLAIRTDEVLWILPRMKPFLCERCQSFLHWNPTNIDDSFEHHASGTALKRSATNHCHLCMHLYRELMLSRRPPEDSDLPNRQICLSFAAPGYSTITDDSFYIRVRVMHEDIRTAGKHDFAKRPDVPEALQIRVEGDSAYDDDLNDVLRQFEEDRKRNSDIHLRLNTKTWLLALNFGLGHALNRYFLNNREVSEDEYFAAALPYYSAKLRLQPAGMFSEAMLDFCNSYGQDSSTSSKTTQVLISCWNHWCREAHPYCRSATGDKPPLLPKRVLDIRGFDTIAPKIRLLIPKSGTRAQYAALSHCWGKIQPLRTLKDNLSIWRKEIKWKDLPRSFADAVIIARARSLDYLWIDSLCIIQDSPEDWAEQSALMGEIYRNCDICIGAADAADATGGCFRDRQGLENRPVKLWETPPDVLLPNYGNCGPVYAFSANSNEEGSSLQQRAWALQEQLLSPRYISFGKGGVSWACLTTELYESSPHSFYGIADWSNGRFDYRKIFQAGISGLLDLKEHSQDCLRLYQSWMLIVEAYSLRELTKSSDRLAALTGIASKFGQATSDQYLAGLWRRYLWRELLWTVYSPSSPRFGRQPLKDQAPAGPQDEFTAPSWSWARIKGAIEYIHMHPMDDHVEHEVLLDILEATCTPSDAGSISAAYTGEIRAKGSLKIAGVLIGGTSLHPFKLMFNLRLDDESYANSEEVTRALEDIRQSEEAKRQNTVHLAIGPSEDDIDDKQADSPRAENLRSKSARAEAQSPQQSSLPPLTHYLRDLDRSAYAYSSRVSQLAKHPRMSFMSGLEEGDDLTGTRYPGHPLRHPQTGAQVGYWAPDYESSDVPYSVVCLAVSKYRGYVLCLGLKQTGRQKNRYKRIGIAFWNANAWDDCNGLGVMECFIV